jgi:phosphonate metabolism-associated iron-containing alcohol dehydrogenase
MVHRFHNPVRTCAGLGALRELPALLGERRALLLSFADATPLGLVELVRQQLGGQLLGVIDDIHPNPDLIDLELLYPQVWQGDAAQAEVLIALGGGSVIDSAKAVMLGTPSRQFFEIRRLLQDGQAFTPVARKALIAVPTTAGTGSEVTPWATVWDREMQRKHSLHRPDTWPEAALVDPVLMRSLPPAVSLQAGLDALSHALEAIWNRHANPISDALAVAAARGILSALPALMREPGCIAHREAMAVAALQAGLAFSNTRTALAHSMSYAMTLRHGLPHGIACSFTLPLVARLAIGRDAERDAVLAQALLPLGPLAQAPQRLEAWLQALGVKTAFADYGVGEAEARVLLDEGLQGERGRNFIGAAA